MILNQETSEDFKTEVFTVSPLGYGNKSFTLKRMYSTGYETSPYIVSLLLISIITNN